MGSGAAQPVSYGPMGMAERTVLVTGASSGIGRECCRVLAEAGARIVLVGRRHAQLEAVRGELSGPGHRVEPFDLRQVDQIEPWFQAVVARAGPLHGLVHCAGVQLTRPLRALKPADVDDVMAVHLDAAIFLAKAFRIKSAHARPASLVLVSSIRGLIGDAAVT